MDKLTYEKEKVSASCGCVDKPLWGAYELIAYKQLPNATYEEMSSELKKIILDSLLKEQGHLCAYCMRRIPETRKLPPGVSGATIER